MPQLVSIDPAKAEPVGFGEAGGVNGAGLADLAWIQRTGRVNPLSKPSRGSIW